MLPENLQLPGGRYPITYPKLLLVEGQDAFQFFKALLQHLDLLDKIEIRNYGGVTDWAAYLNTLKVTSGFASVTSIGIVRDAEANASSAFESVCDGLKQAGLHVPSQPGSMTSGRPRIAVFILPDCESSGMLETLCLRAVENDPGTLCVAEYFACLQRKGLSLPTNMPKAQVHAFLASRPKADLLLGQAAHAGYWPWHSQAFDRLKQFLRAL